MACQYAGGVVLGADSRTSTGTYIANRASDKITCVTDNVWMCRSGSVRCACDEALKTYVRRAFERNAAQSCGGVVEPLPSTRPAS